MSADWITALASLPLAALGFAAMKPARRPKFDSQNRRRIGIDR